MFTYVRPALARVRVWERAIAALVEGAQDSVRQAAQSARTQCIELETVTNLQGPGRPLGHSSLLIAFAARSIFHGVRRDRAE